VRALAEGLTWLTEGDRVTYEVVQGDRGPAGQGPAPRAGRCPRRPRRRTARRRPLEARREAGDVPARGGEGVVARYDAERGFGFITPDAGGADLFVHMSVLVDTEPLHKGERVRYAVRQSDRGPQADRVERV
jgi:CspA family cold shock protein